MNGIEFIEKYPKFYKKSPSELPLWEAIYNQAIVHTRRPEPGEEILLLERQRPNENKTIKEYRANNFRAISKEGVDKFHTKVIRILQNSSVSFESASEQLIEWLEENRFSMNGKDYDIWSFFYFYIIPKSFEDANSLLFAFPQHSDDLTPPALPVSEGGFRPNETIPIVTKVVSHDKIKYIDDEIIAWYGGEKKFKTREYSFYYIVDSERYYLYEPIEKPDNQVEYELVEWYRHDKGSLPLNWVPSRESSRKNYRESFLHPYYEYADEAISRFSDGQAVWVQHAHPKVVLAELSCPDCTGGTIKTTSPDGKSEFVTCKKCDGTGKIKSIAPYDYLVKPKSGIDGQSDIKAIEYVTPPTAALESTFEIPFKLLDKAKKAIGLDVMMDLQESGVAKEYRLEDLQDLLNSFGKAIYDCMERFMYDIEVLLKPNLRNRVEAKIRRPLSYSLKSPEMLKNEAESALPADRIPSALSYYRAKYSNDPVMQKVYEYAYFYSPLLAMTEQEILNRRNAQVYSEIDIIKRDYAVMAFIQLSTDQNFLNWTQADANSRADSYLEEQGLLNPPIDVVT